MALRSRFLVRVAFTQEPAAHESALTRPGPRCTVGGQSAATHAGLNGLHMTITGLLCPRCQQPRAVLVTARTAPLLKFHCQHCGFDWVSLHPSSIKRDQPPPDDNGD